MFFYFVQRKFGFLKRKRKLINGSLLLFSGLKIFIKGARKRWMRMLGVCTTILMSSIYVAKSRKHLRKVVPWNDLHICELFPIKISCLQNEQVLLLFPSLFELTLCSSNNPLLCVCLGLRTRYIVANKR